MSLTNRISFIIIIVCLCFLPTCDKSGSSDTYEPFTSSGICVTSGDNLAYKKGSLVFNMKYVTGGTFPTGTNDLAGTHTISSPYWIGETEVTYQLWITVLNWAKSHGYSFANEGIMGNGTSHADIQNPVSSMNWRDAIVWCNALTEYYNATNDGEIDLECVYYSDSIYTIPLRNSTNSAIISTATGSEDNPFIKSSSEGNTDMSSCTANGFRLPKSMEWECAARYKDGSSWTQGNYASGASDIYSNLDITKTVAVVDTERTEGVKSRNSNSLGIYDMSGNVYEWCFELKPPLEARVMRGGGYLSGSYIYSQIGFEDGAAIPDTYDDVGIRITRSH